MPRGLKVKSVSEAVRFYNRKARRAFGSTRAKPAPSDRFHAAGLKAGGRDNGRPGLRTDYSPTYYAAFLIDADGNNVEAVCLE